MSKVELITKSIGNALKGLNKYAPQGAVKYDLVKVNGNKGLSTIWSFRDVEGNLLRRMCTVRNGDDVLKVNKEFLYSDNMKFVRASEYLKNDCTKYSDTCIMYDRSKKSKDLWMFEQNYLNSNKQSISYFGSSKQPKSISYNTSWDGKIPNNLTTSGINQNNLPKKNLEYLPVFGGNHNGCNINSRINHIHSIHKGRYGLENVLPDIERVRPGSLGYDGGMLAGHCDFGGQVRIDSRIHDSEQLVELIAHEDRHALECSLLNRLERNVSDKMYWPMPNSRPRFILDKQYGIFVRKSIEKGVIPNNSNLGKRVDSFEKNLDLSHKKPHDERAEEVRANLAGAIERTKYNKLVDSVCKSFNAEFRPY